MKEVTKVILSVLPNDWISYRQIVDKINNPINKLPKPIMVFKLKSNP